MKWGTQHRHVQAQLFSFLSCCSPSCRRAVAVAVGAPHSLLVTASVGDLGRQAGRGGAHFVNGCVCRCQGGTIGQAT